MAMLSLAGALYISRDRGHSLVLVAPCRHGIEPALQAIRLKQAARRADYVHLQNQLSELSAEKQAASPAARRNIATLQPPA